MKFPQFKVRVSVNGQVFEERLITANDEKGAIRKMMRIYPVISSAGPVHYDIVKE